MTFTLFSGGVTSAKGFKASAVSAGIRYERNDLALLWSQVPAAAAGVFTTNKIQAAPVKLCQRRLKGGKAQAVIINSGNANACNGERGMADAVRMGAAAAKNLGIDEKLVLVCSTGTIGIPLPVQKIEAAAPLAVKALRPTGGDAAAKAIMTTDTVDKQVAVRLRAAGADIVIGGMAKGSGMIAPNMATMLGFMTTDAAVEPKALRSCLKKAVDQSFNCVTVDGDTSTNDTVLLLANGAAGNAPLTEKHADWPAFCEAVNEVARTLALKVAEDGEGATKLVTVRVVGAASKADARKAARAVANSPLVKTSWYGEDPNWGRVMGAIGYSGAAVTESCVDIRYDGIAAVTGGQAAGAAAAKNLKKVLANKKFTLEIDLHLGSGTHTMYTCDCTIDYVKINGSYMT